MPGSARGTAKVVAKYLLLVKLGIIEMSAKDIDEAKIEFTAEEETDPDVLGLPSVAVSLFQELNKSVWPRFHS